METEERVFYRINPGWTKYTFQSTFSQYLGLLGTIYVFISFKSEKWSTYIRI